MGVVTIGAFEAKTRFSELLRAVERGDEYEIVRRGQPVARLTGHGRDSRIARIDSLLSEVRACRRSDEPVTREEIKAWKAVGRS